MARAVSLFSGAGGDTLGLEAASYTVVAFSERMKCAVATHTTNFPECKHLCTPTSSDITELPDTLFAPNSADVVFAGFPCQGFSKAGKKKADDPRNQMYLQWVRVARNIRPTWVLGENVPGLVSMLAEEGTLVLNRIVAAMAHEGYMLTHKVLDSYDYGVPQHRKRLLLVGKRGAPVPDDFWDEVARHRTAAPTLRSFLLPTLEGAVCLETVPDRFDEVALSAHGTATGTPHPYVLLKAGLLSVGKRSSPHHSEVLDPDKPCKTIICTYAHQPRLLVGLCTPDGKRWVRPLLPQELLQIQGFPKDYHLEGTTKDKIIQIGNAVPPALVRAVASACSVF